MPARQAYSWCNDSVATSGVTPGRFLALRTAAGFVTSAVGSRRRLGSVASWNTTPGVFAVPYRSLARRCSPQADLSDLGPPEPGVVCAVGCGSGESRAWGAGGFGSIAQVCPQNFKHFACPFQTQCLLVLWVSLSPFIHIRLGTGLNTTYSALQKDAEFFFFRVWSHHEER